MSASESARGTGTPTPLALAAGFAAIYLIWGSTFLGIKIAIETIPPFLMGGMRFLTAGLLLFGWARLRGAPPPNRVEVRDAAIVGALLLWLGHGALIWAEQWVASGLASILVATVPIWMVLLAWGVGEGDRPTAATWLALGVGLAGVALLGTGEELAVGVRGIEGRIGAVAILAGCVVWAGGSIFSRRARLPATPRVATAVQMISGGALLAATGTLVGEWGDFDPGAVTARSWLALSYLIVFGSLVAFSSYVWLLRVSTPARVSTYAYVNPVVALLLGWGLAGEPLGARTLLAAALVLMSVAALNRPSRSR